MTVAEVSVFSRVIEGIKQRLEIVETNKDLFKEFSEIPDDFLIGIVSKNFDQEEFSGLEDRAKSLDEHFKGSGFEDDLFYMYIISCGVLDIELIQKVIDIYKESQNK